LAEFLTLGSMRTVVSLIFRASSPGEWIIRRAPSVLGQVLVLLTLTGMARALPIAAQERERAGSDSLLAVFLSAVRRGSPALQSELAVVEAARGRLQATGFATPAVLSFETEEVPGGLNVPDAGSLRIDVGHEFLTGPRRSAARSVAQSDFRAAQLSYEIIERRLLAHGHRALIRLLGWSAIARRLGDEDALLESAEGALRIRFTVGEARYVDVLRLRTERLRVQTNVAAAIGERDAARRQLEALVGEDSVGLAALAGITDSTIGVPGAVRPGVLKPVSSTILGELPPAPDADSLLAFAGAVRRAEVMVERAQGLRQLALARRRPIVTASLGVQRFADDAGGFTIGPTLGASMSLPFIASKAGGAAVHAAETTVTAAQAQRRAALISARVALRAAHDRYEVARRRLSVFQSALLKGAQDERGGALASYRNGQLSLLELIDFERALSRAETDRLRIRIEAADALAELLSGDATIDDASAEPSIRTGFTDD
jgi:outer membrane protein, heavy metal efflux system